LRDEPVTTQRTRIHPPPHRVPGPHPGRAHMGGRTAGHQSETSPGPGDGSNETYRRVVPGTVHGRVDFAVSSGGRLHDAIHNRTVAPGGISSGARSWGVMGRHADARGRQHRGTFAVARFWGGPLRPGGFQPVRPAGRTGFDEAANLGGHGVEGRHPTRRHRRRPRAPRTGAPFVRGRTASAYGRRGRRGGGARCARRWGETGA